MRSVPVLILLACAFPILAACSPDVPSSGRADASVVADLSQSSKETKKSALEDAIRSQMDHSMDTVDLYFADLMFTRAVAPSAGESLTGRVDESWMYSLEEDLTVVVDIDRRRPLAWFYGKAVDADELSVLRAQVRGRN